MSDSPSGPVPVLDGLGAIADRYDAFIVDLWGVVHNGERPYPGVIDALRRARAAGRQVCLLSNAPRRIATVLRSLEFIGVPRDAFDHLMSSGEATYRALADPPDAFHRALGPRFHHMGPPRDVDVHEGLEGRILGTLAEADWVLNTGIDGPDETLADFEEALQAARARDLPMVCANPDLVVMWGRRLAICAGTIAQRYEALGGRVAYHGKPHPPVYRLCFGLLGEAAAGRILAIGDSFRTDIAGAAAVGIDSLLVVGGIHAEELGLAPGQPPDGTALAEAAAAHGHRPTYAIGHLAW